MKEGLAPFMGSFDQSDTSAPPLGIFHSVPPVGNAAVTLPARVFAFYWLHIEHSAMITSISIWKRPCSGNNLRRWSQNLGDESAMINELSDPAAIFFNKCLPLCHSARAPHWVYLLLCVSFNNNLMKIIASAPGPYQLHDDSAQCNIPAMIVIYFSRID